MTTAVFDTLFGRQEHRAQTLGDIFVKGKNQSNQGINNHKFGLFGDPSMRLALPRYTVATTSINNKNASSVQKDTVRALQKVTIEGAILDDDGKILTNFNGTIFPTIFDKAATLRTLGQSLGGDQSYPRDFTVQRNIIFKGAASVKNGLWAFSFVVPKDIDYAFGTGKISYYASDSVSIDATGNFENFIVGGSSLSASDNQPPVVKVFMNDFTWTSGATTTQNPVLLVELSDDNGINVSGTSIGHDLTATLTNIKNPYILNDFYQATRDNMAKGTVRYPLSNLAAGTYKVTVKAWDVANNSGEGSTEFIVAENSKTALEHVLAYPNPFSTKTYIRFEHNLSGTDYRVNVGIYNMIGQLVKTINQSITPNGNLIDNIEWDADKGLASGMYVYKVTLSAVDNKNKRQSVESSFQRVVLIK